MEQEVITHTGEQRPVRPTTFIFENIEMNGFRWKVNMQVCHVCTNIIIFFGWDEFFAEGLDKLNGQIILRKIEPSGETTIVHLDDVEITEESNLFPVHLPQGTPDFWKNCMMSFEFRFVVNRHPIEKICYVSQHGITELNDTPLDFDGQIIYVNKGFMAANSIFFRCLFKTISGRITNETFTFSGVSAEDFGMMLSTIYRNNHIPPKDTKIEELLVLANRFFFPSVIEAVETHLVNCSKIEKAKILWIAEKHKLSNIIFKILETASVTEYEEMKDSRYFPLLSRPLRGLIE